MNWNAVLDNLTVKVEELEQRLDLERWEELEETPFAPPDVEGDMTREQRDRAVALLERVSDCRKRLESQMAEGRQELANLDARKKGARSYVSSDIGA